MTDRNDSIDAHRSPHDDPGRQASHAVSLLDEHLRLYRELDALGERQRALIDEDNTDALLGVLAERQRRIEELLRVGEELRPIQQRWDLVLSRAPEPVRERMRERVEEIQRIAQRVSDRDEHDKARLASRRDQISSELQDVNRSRGAVAAYGRQGASQHARYQDRQG